MALDFTLFENTKKSHFDKSLLQMPRNGDFKIEKLVENTKIRKFKCDIGKFSNAMIEPWLGPNGIFIVKKTKILVDKLSLLWSSLFTF